ncbi:LYR motif-containing protein 4 [Linum grandiflorum]
MASTTVSRGEILSLFRSLLRTARQFSDYNIREYTKLRTVDGFKQNRGLTEPFSISAVYFDGKSQLEVAKRQAAVYSLYAPKIKSVMEIHLKGNL